MEKSKSATCDRPPSFPANTLQSLRRPNSAGHRWTTRPPKYLHSRRDRVGTSALSCRFIAVMSNRLNLAYIRPAIVFCLACKAPMQEKTGSAADIIDFTTLTKMVTYKCPNCGRETQRQVTIPAVRAKR